MEASLCSLPSLQRPPHTLALLQKGYLVVNQLQCCRFLHVDNNCDEFPSVYRGEHTSPWARLTEQTMERK